MKVNLRKLNQLIDKKYLSVQKHPTEELLVWNYTHNAQFDRYWTEETMMCRGLITDTEGKVFARPFKKFFNYSEHIEEDSKLPNLPVEEFEVFDKLDGSLGILYQINGKPYLATRGSFVSEQAERANKLLKQKYSELSFHPQYTYLFEIIYPENKIVVNYGVMEDLYLLAVVETATGFEVPYESVKKTWGSYFPIVERFDGLNDLEEIKKMVKDNSEGFVIRFKSGVRVKLKFEEYVRLHRLVTGVNAKTIWEHLKDGTGVKEIIDRVPDEFFQWVNETVDNLTYEYGKIERQAIDVYEKVRQLDSRKEQALSMKDSLFKGIVFKMLDKQPFDELIWKMIRPVAERPFKKDIDV